MKRIWVAFGLLVGIGCSHYPWPCHDTGSSTGAAVGGSGWAVGRSTSQYNMCSGRCCWLDKKGRITRCSCTKQCGCWTNEEHNKLQQEIWKDPKKLAGSRELD